MPSPDSEPNPAAARPLDGVRVLELGQLLAGAVRRLRPRLLRRRGHQGRAARQGRPDSRLAAARRQRHVVLVAQPSVASHHSFRVRSDPPDDTWYADEGESHGCQARVEARRSGTPAAVGGCQRDARQTSHRVLEGHPRQGAAEMRPRRVGAGVERPTNRRCPRRKPNDRFRTGASEPLSMDPKPRC